MKDALIHFFRYPLRISTSCWLCLAKISRRRNYARGGTPVGRQVKRGPGTFYDNLEKLIAKELLSKFLGSPQTTTRDGAITE